MVFQSFPIYPDPPNSWPQQQGSTGETPQVPPVQPLSHGGGGGVGGGSASSIKPGSMAERARLAKIPTPEAALNCPRCESTNTKFCYFNNYSLSQPRHFCKACRRYWTRGGALRNVPVGGGCRRNKRSKGNGSRSKSPAKAAGPSSSSELDSNSCPNDVIGHMAPPLLQVPFLPPLQSLVDYNSTDIGLNFTRIQPPTTVNGGGMEFNAGTTNSSSGVGGGVGTILSNGLVEQWRLQHIPLQANLELQSGGLYQFEGQGIDHHSQNFVGQHRSKPTNTVPTQLSTVKMEANQGLNLSRNFLGIAGNDQYWGSNAWSAELPGFTSTSTSNLL